VDIDSVNGLQL